MAESQNIAFGRYLRTLRERRGLSLQEVCSLSQAFAETLNKGYLSRCENGRQRIAFSKAIPLSRIYRAPGDVLFERQELDQELDRVGSPDTEGLSFSELSEAGRVAINKGYCWHGYGFFRDAIQQASIGDVTPPYRDINEQQVCSFMHCATASRLLGRRRFAFHEFQFVEQSEFIGPKFRPIVLERLAQSYRTLNQLELAKDYGDKAIVEAERNGSVDYLGYVYGSRAHLALQDGELELAVDLYKKAHKAFKQAGRGFECVRTMNNLAQVYFDLGRFRTSRRILVAAEKVTGSGRQLRARALGRILMGEIDALEKKDGLAANHWKEAAQIAKQLDDKVLRFKAEFLLFKQAHETGNQPVTRALHRRLKRLSHWVPGDTAELQSFREISAPETRAHS